MDGSSKAPFATDSDFRISWPEPTDAKLTWYHDLAHYREPLTPLDFDLRIRSVVAGSNRVARAWELPFANRVGLFNGYVYGTMIILDDDPEALARGIQQQEEQVRQDMFNLEKLWAESYLPEVKTHLDYWKSYDLNGASWPDLLNHLSETQKRAERLWEIHTRVFIPALVAISEFEQMYEDLFEAPTTYQAHDLLAGSSNQTVVGGLWLWRLSRQALASPTVKEILENTALTPTCPNNGRGENAASVITHLESCVRKLKETEAGQAFWADVTAYLQEHGHCSDLIYLNQVSWLEDPTHVIKTLQIYMTQPERDTSYGRKKMSAIAKRREEGIAKAYAQLEDYPEFVVSEFERLLKAAQVGTILSEDHNYWIDNQAYYQMRQVCLAVGQRLVQKEVIDHREDVFYLTLAEILKLTPLRVSLKESQLGAESAHLQALVRTRQSDLKRYTNYTPPLMIGAPPEQPATAEPPTSGVWRALSKFHSMIPIVSEETNTLKGYPGSSGQATGRAKVVRTLAEADKIEAGDILVAPVTLPSWTPLFATVAAVVTDTGGILSHAGIVAREYGIPAVVSTHTGTSVIKDGQLIEVDGNTGVVRIQSN